MPRNREPELDPSVLTLADLRLALDQKERTLRQLLARKEQLAQELEELGETMQAMLFGSDAAAGRRAAPARAARKSAASRRDDADDEDDASVKTDAMAARPRRRGRPPKSEASDAGGEPSAARAGSLQAVIRSVLERVIGPLKVSEIVAAVLQSGYASKSANLNVIVGNRLAQMEDVEKVDRGLYQLKRNAATDAPPEPPPLINIATA